MDGRLEGRRELVAQPGISLRVNQTRPASTCAARATDREVERDAQTANCTAGDGGGVRLEGPINRAGRSASPSMCTQIATG